MKRVIAIWAVLALAGSSLLNFRGQPSLLGAPVEEVVAAVEEQAAVSPPLSAPVAEVVRLAESGVDEEVILAYVEGSQAAFGLSAEAVIYLKDIGIEASVIAAMLRHDSALLEQAPRTAPATATTNQFIYDQKLYSPGPNVSVSSVVTPAVEPVYVTNAPPEVHYFYSALEPYGSWIELDNLGWCWQPRIVVVDRSWRPYWHGGRWLWTDGGWYWQSEYSWGWAPFHYGRWDRHARHGWVWFPDTVWAPAWVSWRYSDRYCGWAPLPLGARFVVGQGWRFNNVSVGINFDFGLGIDFFNFVEIRHMQERHPNRHGVPPAEVREIHGRTTVVNNYVTGNNNTIINQGIPVERVSAASRSEVRKVAIRDVPREPGKTVKPDRIVKEGPGEVVYRPELKPPATPSVAVAQRIDERHPVVRSLPSRLDATARPAQRPSTRISVPSRSTVPSQSATAQPKGLGVGPPRATAPAVSAPPVIRSEVPKARESTSSAPSPARAAPATPTTMRPSIQAPQRAATRPSPPRSESPKGREQRLSDGSAIRWVPSTQRSSAPAPAQASPSVSRQPGPASAAPSKQPAPAKAVPSKRQ